MSSQIQIQERRLKAWELYIRGESPNQISQLLSVDPETTKMDLKALPKEWEDKIRTLDEQRLIELNRLEAIEGELWQAWEKSKLDKEVRTEVTMTGGQSGGGSSSSVQVSGQVGDVRFLTEALKCMDRRARLLGLDAPTKVLSIQIRWDLLSPEQIDRLSSGEEYRRVLDPTQYFLG